MLPAQLQAESFERYRAQGKRVAVANLLLLRQLPPAFVPFLLKEIISYDAKFPIERRELDAQLSYLTAMDPAKREGEMKPFASLRLTEQLTNADWINDPTRFLELLSAHLWATGQIDGFRQASVDYVSRFHATLPAETLPVSRLGIVVIGRGVESNDYPLFRKLRRRGTYYRNVEAESAWAAITACVTARADAHPIPYGHWYVDGGRAEIRFGVPVTCVSYEALTPVRMKIAASMKAAYESPDFGAEALRTKLAQMGPEELGMSGAEADDALNRFQISLLTEGSGTQIYSTTFVQWAAREAFRRAQPVTLVARYAPRVREKSMGELLSGTSGHELDPRGSLIDADMGAYYTWINQQKLPGADSANFVAWFEGHGEAVWVGGRAKPGLEVGEPTSLAGVLKQTG